MRIVRGKLKSRRIQVPKGFASRPTTDFAKEGLFNILDNRFEIAGITVLDLCSGTGNITLEFISGGVQHVTAVDQNFACVRYLNKIAKELDVANEVSVLKGDVVQFLKKSPQKFDLIFADPPYAADFHREIITTVFERDLLNEGGLLIVEHGKQTQTDDLPHFDFMKKYGSVHFSFFQKD